MAAYGGVASGVAGGNVTAVRTGNLNVTGTDLALVVGACEVETFTETFTFAWDPDGNNESMTGSYATVNVGSYVGGEMEYLDDPTAANAPVEVTYGTTANEVGVFAVFATAAGDITGTDNDTDSFATTGTSLSATVPNAATDDLLVDMAILGNLSAMTAGADQTARITDQNIGSYGRYSVSTQAGGDGGVMSWTFADPNYGGALIAVRIPNAGAASGGGYTNSLSLTGVG